jgi:hypothetical protein
MLDLHLAYAKMNAKTRIYQPRPKLEKWVND